MLVGLFVIIKLTIYIKKLYSFINILFNIYLEFVLIIMIYIELKHLVHLRHGFILLCHWMHLVAEGPVHSNVPTLTLTDNLVSRRWKFTSMVYIWICLIDKSIYVIFRYHLLALYMNYGHVNEILIIWVMTSHYNIKSSYRSDKSTASANI